MARESKPKFRAAERVNPRSANEFSIVKCTGARFRFNLISALHNLGQMDFVLRAMHPARLNCTYLLVRDRVRRDPVLPAPASASAQTKRIDRHAAGGFPVHSFDTLLPPHSQVSSTVAPPDYGLLPRVANDPNRDLYNTPPPYGSYTPRASQPRGTFTFSSSPAELGQAFLRISSMILRLSR